MSATSAPPKRRSLSAKPRLAARLDSDVELRSRPARSGGSAIAVEVETELSDGSAWEEEVQPAGFAIPARTRAAATFSCCVISVLRAESDGRESRISCCETISGSGEVGSEGLGFGDTGLRGASAGFGRSCGRLSPNRKAVRPQVKATAQTSRRSGGSACRMRPGRNTDKKWTEGLVSNQATGRGSGGQLKTDFRGLRS